jgi:hypothetical protein
MVYIAGANSHPGWSTTFNEFEVTIGTDESIELEYYDVDENDANVLEVILEFVDEEGNGNPA